jgi:hypothetical protein
MAAISQRHVVDVVMKECQRVAEESGRPGYAKELLDITTNIISMENDQLIRQGPIQKNVSDQVNVLAGIIQTNGWVGTSEEK